MPHFKGFSTIVKGIAIFLAVFIGFSPINAEESIVDVIIKQSENTITINIPDNIQEKITTPIPRKDQSITKSGVSKAMGFRIQVFSDGRNQNTLEARAKSRGNSILNKFPKYKGQIYTYSSSPNWYTRIGNFKTRAEANSALTELKKAFPQFANEMRVVKSQIVVIK